MASAAAKLSLFLLLTLLSSLHTHARDSQFFNKIPSTTNNKESLNTQQQQQQEPNFLPENENSYGLYGHESGQNPPSTATATTLENTEFKQSDNKYLPKNYNPVAYVTQPENVDDNTPFTQQTSFTTTTTNNNNNGEQNYYNNNNQQQEEGEAEFRSYPTTANNYLYNGGSSFNSQPQGQNNGENYGFQPQGMSDTRKMANGRYFYDINTEKYSRNHPYESLRAQSEFNNRNFYQNNAEEFNNFNSRNFYGNNANDFNAEGYQSRQDFQDEENLP